MRTLAALLVAWLLVVAMPRAHATGPLRLAADMPVQSLEGRLEHFAEAGATMDYATARRQVYEHLPDFRSLGYGTGANWFRVSLARQPDAPDPWILVIGAPLLENVDVWVTHADGTVQHHALGYHRPFAQRPLHTREFALPLHVGAGAEVHFRVQTKNAILVQAAIWQQAAFSGHETRSNFWRGLYFGVLLIAIVLYALLGARLRDAAMGAYAGYLASLTLLHLGSSGYLPLLLPDGSGWFADALPRIGWLGGAATIVIMWDRLLDLRHTHPRIHQLYLGTVWFNLGLLPFALMPFLVGAWLLQVVKFANALNSVNLVISMVLLLGFWWRTRKVEFMLYFTAFIVPTLGVAVNTAMNNGLLPQNAFTSNFYPLAMPVHVLVMSLGLVMRLRQLQDDKAAAEHAAAVAAGRADEQRRFVAMLSHEFGNPLAAIDRAAQLIQVKTPELPPAEAQRLAQIRANVARLSGYVDNFLMSESLEHGALAVAPEPCELRPLLEVAIRAQGDEGAARVHLGECPPGAFTLDPSFIGVALGNLLANALRYSPAGSPIDLSAARRGEQGLSIRVRDHGPGLSPDELERLGTPYFRAASSLGTKGSGLGYYFTQRIIEAHGGTMSARAAPGGGVEVEVVLS